METEDIAAPLLSVTVLNYNYGHFLPTCLESILSQTFTDFEVILINDTSTDNSLEIIQPYLNDKRIRLVDHKVNQGFVGSLIEGAELSRGKYITVISADDWVLDPTAFSKQITVLEQDPEVVFAYTAYGHFEVEGKCEHVWRAAETSYIRPGRESFEEIVLNPYILHSGTIIRKTAYIAIGGYTPTLRYAVDVRMWLGLCHVGKVAYINEILYAYRRHGSSMSKNPTSIRRTIEEVLAALDWSFSLLPADDQKQLRQLQKRANKKALIAFAADEIFRDCYRAGWRGFGIAMRTRPTQTLFQKMTLLLALRTILSSHRYAQLRAAMSRVTVPKAPGIRDQGPGHPEQTLEP